MYNRPSSHRGFTLIELLVVIAVVSILAAILFPVFAKAREKARQTTCTSNERQIGMCITQYVQDNDEVMPVRMMELPPDSEISWRTLIQPYIRSIGIFLCPSNPSRDLSDLSDDGLHPSYEAARYDGGAGGAFRDNGTVPLAQISSPATSLEVVESTARWSEYRVNATGFDLQRPLGYTTDDEEGGSMFGHVGATNFLFCDGHVKAMKPLATVDTAERGSGTLNMWTVDNSAFASSADVDAVYANLSYAQKLLK